MTFGMNTELHNLLKKIWPQEASNVTFQRMPNVKVGHADVKTQVYDLMLQYAPIGADELAMRYEETYGVKAATVRGNYFGCIDPYYYNGSYRVDYVPLPEDVHRRLEQILTGDFYTIRQAEALYRHEFPNAANEPLNPYTLKSLGFYVYPGYSGYIVKNTFSGAVDYFQKFLTGEDRIDLRKYPQFRNITTFATVRHRLCAAYRIVEYLPQQYVNERHLRAARITKDELLDYCRAADEFCGDEYVTILSLRKKGFSHSLDRFGFDEWFYASILMEDTRHFSGYRIGGTHMFRHGASGGDFVGMLTWLLRTGTAFVWKRCLRCWRRNTAFVCRRTRCCGSRSRWSFITIRWKRRSIETAIRFQRAFDGMADADRPFAVPPAFCRIWRQLLRISLKSTKKRQKTRDGSLHKGRDGL